MTQKTIYTLGSNASIVERLRHNPEEITKLDVEQLADDLEELEEWRNIGGALESPWLESPQDVIDCIVDLEGKQ